MSLNVEEEDEDDRKPEIPPPIPMSILVIILLLIKRRLSKLNIPIIATSDIGNGTNIEIVRLVPKDITNHTI
jgi:hypothetical protein